MKKYRVTVNGTVYEVELEDVEADSGGETEAGTTQRDVVRHGVARIPVSFSVTAKWLKKLAGYAKLDKICAPMPGNILAVNVSNGSAVKKGDVLMILEAMKMENEIMAPHDGTITAVSVTKGASVESGALLCTIA